ncbi:hypothetical protein [Pseudomonas fluorescens]|uniref:hypothetical protein n=1 Tax=Pseudomonas fluorescens TaxID=294 RepID=UPI001242E9AE|nr:hypothetical protein [Pseudomonas fluorescens]VVO70013.1 hypothetical protein PS898_01243 [Pseudomonas fluorescens]
MEIIRANGIAFIIVKGGYITRRLLKFGSEETTGYLYSTEYEALSSCMNHYFTFEVSSDFEEQTHHQSDIEAEFRTGAAKHFQF